MALNQADLKKLLQDHDLGLLIIRIAIGGAVMAAGVPKFMGGQATLMQVGEAMGFVGIHFAPLFWGILAALTEVMGGFMILLGFLFRPAAFFLMFVMAVATLMLAHTSQNFWQDALTPISYFGVFAGLLFAGPGKLSVQKN